MSESEERLPQQSPEKSLMIFGRDVAKIPCFRSSFLFGSLSGITFGLIHFLFTSKVAKSANYSVCAFSFITMGCWMHCRYQYSKAKFEMMKLQELLREKAWTGNDPVIEEQIEMIDV